MKFAALDLAPELLHAVESCGYQQMTPIQQKAIVAARRGKDVLAHAQTGTGKTAAFCIPILQKMIDSPKPAEPGDVRALIMTPTRELAEQITDKLKNYATGLNLKIVAAFGGTNISSQQGKLRRGADIVVATPGRMLEHMTQCNLDLASTEFVVLDEADRMLDMGFSGDVLEILSKATGEPQVMLFSATGSPELNTLSGKLLKNPSTIRITKQNTVAETVQHVLYPVSEDKKPDLFAKLIKEQNWFQVLVFTSTKRQADELIGELKYDGIKAAICHGDKSQGARRRALKEFSEGKIQVLVATEVAARGIDIQGLEFVVNYNLPFLPEDYVHRIGRTGRAGQAGTAISFVSRDEERSLDAIERLIDQRIKRIYLREFNDDDQRVNLRKRLAKGPGAVRRNKATKTKIGSKGHKKKRK